MPEETEPVQVYNEYSDHCDGCCWYCDDRTWCCHSITGESDYC